MDTSCKNRVLESLEQHKGSFISGGALAHELGVSRNAVWKAVKSLVWEGYEIESVTGRGYRLEADSSILSAASIAHYLTSPSISLEYHDSIDSTNTRCKALAENGAPEGTLVVANEQTAGRGRQGRPFYSPAGTGVYFTLLLRPDFSVSDLTLITTYSAVCLARVIDHLFGVRSQIKWVNDLFVNGHKVSGILTEASLDAENGHVAYLVVGIGVNVRKPDGGFPAEITSVADALSGAGGDEHDQRARIVAGFADEFMRNYREIPSAPHLAEYRERSLLDGRSVTVHEGKRSFEAKVIGVNDDFTLEVELEDGTRRALNHGEVHIPSDQL